VDDKLKFDIHVEAQVSKANKILGLIRRTFDNLDKDTLTGLYKTLVRPHLEYCNAVVYPQYQKQAKLLESVQRRATKLVPGLKDMEYEKRLEALKLPSLVYRRKRGDMIEVFKYTHNIYKVPMSPFEMERSNTRGHSYKIAKKRCQSSLRQNFFSNRVVNLWNSLPEDVVSSDSLNGFKNSLDLHWSDLKYVTDSSNSHACRTY
jgi:hypothetical protein